MPGARTPASATRSRCWPTAALRIEYARRELAAGFKTWPSADVIPWDAWLARCATDRTTTVPQGRRLGSSEEWLLWRDAAQQACAGLDMLAPGRLADSL